MTTIELFLLVLERRYGVQGAVVTQVPVARPGRIGCTGLTAAGVQTQAQELRNHTPVFPAFPPTSM
jgi:hypothetical protein